MLLAGSRHAPIAIGDTATLAFSPREGIVMLIPMEDAHMAEPVQRTLSGYRIWRTRADALAYIASLEEEIAKRVKTYRAIKAERSPTPQERRAFLLIDGLSDFAARARDELQDLPD